MSKQVPTRSLVYVCLVTVIVLLGGKGVRVSTPFINVFPWYTIIFMPPKLLL
jgi:hypothetical protein